MNVYLKISIEKLKSNKESKNWRFSVTNNPAEKTSWVGGVVFPAQEYTAWFDGN